jgi:hypothetical protein
MTSIKLFFFIYLTDKRQSLQKTSKKLGQILSYIVYKLL